MMPYGNDYDNDGNVVNIGPPAPPWDEQEEAERLRTMIETADQEFHGDIVLVPKDTAGSRSWQPVNLEPVLDGTYTPPRPTVGARTDGVGLFYPGRQHTIASESEAGKSWLALDCTATELARGHGVLYVDFEDDEGGVVGRLLALQVKPDHIRQHFAYLRPEGPLTDPANTADLRAAIGDLTPTLGIVDGVTEGMVMHGLDPLSNKDAAQFGRMLPGRLAQTGIAVASLDHVTKSAEGRGRYAIGAVHKLNGLNGAAYLLENRQPFGIGLTGKSTIRIAKDRPGQLRRQGLPSTGGVWFADLNMNSHGETFTEIAITPPSVRDPEFRPTHIMEKLAALIVKHGPISGQQIQVIAKGKADNNRQALTFLELDGFITKSPHKLLKPYPPPDDEEVNE